jgi:hypothetical protein
MGERDNLFCWEEDERVVASFGRAGAEFDLDRDRRETESRLATDGGIDRIIMKIQGILQMVERVTGESYDTGDMGYCEVGHLWMYTGAASIRHRE